MRTWDGGPRVDMCEDLGPIGWIRVDICTPRVDTCICTPRVGVHMYYPP